MKKMYYFWERNHVVILFLLWMIIIFLFFQIFYLAANKINNRFEKDSNNLDYEIENVSTTQDESIVLDF